MRLTATPSGSTWAASESPNASTACLLMLYTPRLPDERIPEIELIVTIRPFEAAMSGRKALVMRNGP